MIRALFMLLACCLCLGRAEASPPGPTGMVTDTADLLPAGVQDQLEQELLAYRDATSIEIAVLIVPTLDGKSPYEYAAEVWSMNVWKIGQAEENNGVLLLVVPPPEKIAWIATGYGIKPYLGDSQATVIVNDVMMPLNRLERRDEAVVAGVRAIISSLGNTPWVQRAEPGLTQDQWTIILIVAMIVIIVLVVVIAIWMSSGRRGGYGGGGYGSGFFDGYLWGSSGGGGYSGGSSSDSGFSGGGGDGGGGGGGSD